jgi:multiple sugar transport system substrate-binding protein
VPFLWFQYEELLRRCIHATQKEVVKVNSQRSAQQASDRRWSPRLALGSLVLGFVLLAVSLLSATAQQTITFLTAPWGVPPDKDLLKKFETQSGISVQVISVPAAELYTKVQVASAARRAPADVIYLTEEAPSFIVAPGYMEPLNDFIARTPGLDIGDIERMDFWTIGGKVQGVPAYVQLVMMDYNNKRLKAGGFSNPAKSWEELRQHALTLKQRGVDNYPIAFGAIDWSWFLMALSSGDAMFDKDLNPVFSKVNSPARKAMAMLIGFFTKDKVISPDMLTKVTPHDVFMGGTGVYHQAWQGSLAVMNNPKISKQAPDVRYMLMPDKHFTWSLDAAIGLSRFSVKKEAGWKFIQWYLSPENQRAIYKAVGLIPSRKSVQKALNNEGAIQDYEVMVEQAKYVHQLPRTAKWWGPWTQSVTDAIRRSIQGQLTPDEAVSAIAKRWDELRAQYKK